MKNLPTNVKVIIGLVALIVLAVVGFVAVTKMGSQTSTTQLSQIQQTTTIVSPSPSVAQLSPLFNELSSWVPTATWAAPTATTMDTSYGKLTGFIATGEIKGANPTIKRNYENVESLKNLGYVEDMSFAADGPGASNWGYKKVENGKMQVVQISYSTNRLLGPESKSAPFVNLSVFVSDPFVK